MKLGFGPKGVEVQEPDDLARPLRHQEVRVRRALATVDACGDRRRLVGLTDNGGDGGRIHQAHVLAGIASVPMAAMASASVPAASRTSTS